MTSLIDLIDQEGSHCKIGVVEPDMSSDLEWHDAEHNVNNLQRGKEEFRFVYLIHNVDQSIDKKFSF